MRYFLYATIYYQSTRHLNSTHYADLLGSFCIIKYDYNNYNQIYSENIRLYLCIFRNLGAACLLLGYLIVCVWPDDTLTGKRWTNLEMRLFSLDLHFKTSRGCIIWRTYWMVGQVWINRKCTERHGK